MIPADALIRALEPFVVVLVEPRLAINIGTVVRAMKNMGLTRLRLVRPEPDIEFDRVQISAHRTTDIVDALETFDGLDEALADCHYVVGTTARSRSADWIVSTPAEAAPELHERAGSGEQIAIVFGRERTGLTNAELDHCDAFLTIPTRADYSSLNLAQASLICFYELMQATPAALERRDAERAAAREPRVLATASQRRRLLAQIEHSLEGIHFFKSSTRDAIMRSLGRILARAELDAQETRLLIGVFVEILKFAKLVQRGIFPMETLPDSATVSLDEDES